MLARIGKVPAKNHDLAKGQFQSEDVGHGGAGGTIGGIYGVFHTF